MIQRIQTLYFIFIILIAAGLFFFPIYQIELLGETITPYFITDHLSLLLSTILVIVLTGINIFLFRNRPLQIKIGWLTFILIAVLTILIRLTFREVSSDGDNFIFTPSYSAYLPFLMLILKVMAIRGIKKDDELVKSADRFR